MDLREIQRLHAQFAPDTVTIDLTSQIAALPSPAFERRDSRNSVGRRWSDAGPLAKRCTLSLVAAAVLASAGVGAAVLYRSFQANTSPSALVSAQDGRGELHPARIDTTVKPPPVFREIDAAEPTHISAAPVLTASDLSGATPLGLTSDRFRRSLGSQVAPAQGLQSHAPSDEQLAMASPIRRPSALAPQSATSGTGPAIAEPVQKQASTVAASQTAVNGQLMPQQIVVVSPMKVEAVTAATPTKEAMPAVPAAPAIAASSQIAKSARAIHHRAVRNHEGQTAQDVAPSSDPSKQAPASAKASGSNEVQMF